MNNIRDNTGVVLWILVFAFGVIWVLQDSGGLDVIGNVGTNVGSVNGAPITLEEYSRMVDSQAQNYQTQTGNPMPVQMLDQTRDRVFDQLVDNELRMQEMERLGLDVSDSELVEMVQGETPHPIITMNFGDGEGNVDRALLQNFIENPDRRLDWIQIEDYLRNERRRTKLDGLITGTVRISPQDVDHEYQQRNRKVDVRYVASRFTTVSDDSISYTDSDLRRFYNQHKTEFERKKSYSVAYVTASKAPTGDDSAAVFSDIAGLRQTFASTKDDSLFLLRNGSERPFSDAFFSRYELDNAIADAVFENPVAGEIIGPLVSGNQVHLVKILDTREPEEAAVEARHILIRVPEGDEEADKAAREESNALLAKLRGGEDFATLAREQSDDTGSAQNGGSLGWFGPGRMVPEFEKAAFDAPIGRVVGPIKTQFGYHLIEVIDRSKLEVRVADFAISLRASVATLNRVQEELDDLQYFAEETGDFEGEAGRRSYLVNTVQIEDEQAFVPGIGNSRQLMIFLETAGVGDLSPVIELDDQFIAGVLTEVQPSGVRPFDEVKVQIEPRLRNELKADLLASRMRAALNNGFDSLADAMGTAERSGRGLSYANMLVDGIGRDPEFVGTAIGMAPGTVSDVIIGINSVYVIMVENITDPEPATAEEREQIYSQLLRSKQNMVRSQWISTLRDRADIVDNRRLFLQ